jgi:FkbM family methyltransferase
MSDIVDKTVPAGTPRSRRTILIQLDPLETALVAVLLIAAVSGGLAWWTARSAAGVNPVQSAVEVEALRQRYGPSHFSEREEEWIIRDFFRDRPGGFFVDVGANSYKWASKTYFLESQLGWSGLAIEPQTQFAADYATYRPRTKFFPFFVSDVSNSTARLYVLKRSSMVASSDKAFVERFGTPDEVRDVPTITLTDLLDSEHVTRIDLLSLDIELHEPAALKGFDIDRFKPALVCVEALLPVRQQILNYFAEHRYAIVGRYVWADLENLYFAPLESLQQDPAAR